MTEQQADQLPDKDHEDTADETDDPEDTNPEAATGDATEAERGELPAEIPDAARDEG